MKKLERKELAQCLAFSRTFHFFSASTKESDSVMITYFQSFKIGGAIAALLSLVILVGCASSGKDTIRMKPIQKLTDLEIKRLLDLPSGFLINRRENKFSEPMLFSMGPGEATGQIVTFVDPNEISAGVAMFGLGKKGYEVIWKTKKNAKSVIAKILNLSAIRPILWLSWQGNESEQEFFGVVGSGGTLSKFGDSILGSTKLFDLNGDGTYEALVESPKYIGYLKNEEMSKLNKNYNLGIRQKKDGGETNARAVEIVFVWDENGGWRNLRTTVAHYLKQAAEMLRPAISEFSKVPKRSSKSILALCDCGSEVTWGRENGKILRDYRGLITIEVNRGNIDKARTLYGDIRNRADEEIRHLEASSSTRKCILEGIEKLTWHFAIVLSIKGQRQMALSMTKTIADFDKRITTKELSQHLNTKISSGRFRAISNAI